MKEPAIFCLPALYGISRRDGNFLQPMRGHLQIALAFHKLHIAVFDNRFWQSRNGRDIKGIVL